MIRKTAISSALLLSILISLIVERNVLGKHYFTLSFTLVFAVYLTVEFVLFYISFRKTYTQRYKIYKAEKVNSSNITMQVIDRENKKYYRRFKRSMLKDSFLRFSPILVCIGASVAIIVSMCI